MGEAFRSAVTLWIVALAAGALATATAGIATVSALGFGTPALRRELWLRLLSWCWLVPLLVLPVLAGRAWTIAGTAVLGVLCFSEYARATGLFRERQVALTVVLGILAVDLAALDHWYELFMALIPLGSAAIAVATLPLDRPQGYIQRVALGIFGFVLFGAGLGHLGYIANDANYRPIVLMLLLAVGLNDVFAFTVGKLLGGPKLAPRTSPNKTITGALGALVLTAALVAILAEPVFAGTAMAPLPRRILLGLVVSAAGQLGDLMLSAIKRDIGIKDMGAAIPGHGGILDRFNSLLLAAPAAFHLIGYFVGFGLDRPTRVLF